MLQVRLLGAVELSVHGRRMRLSPRLQLLAGFLFWKHAEWVRRRELAATFWPLADEEHASQALRTSLYRLRHILDENEIGHLLAVENEAIRVHCTQGCVIDVHQFDAAAIRGLAGGRGSFSHLTRAANLSYDQFLADVDELIDGDRTWLEAERRRLSEQRIAVLRTLVKRLKARAYRHAAIEHARSWCEADPLSEEACKELMRLYSAIGEPAAALLEYGRYESRLHEELGVAPSESARTLASRMARRSGSPAREPALPTSSPELQDFGRAASPAVTLAYGEAWIAQGDLDRGLSALRLAIEGFGQGKDVEGAARARIALAEALMRTGQPTPEVLEAAHSAVDTFRAIGPITQLAYALLLLSEIHYSQNMVDLSIDAALEGLGICQVSALQDLEARFHLRLALAYVATYQVDSARDAFSRFMDAPLRLSRPSDLVSALMSRSALYMVVGEIPRAEQDLRDALTMVESLPPSPPIDMLLTSIRLGLAMLLHGQERDSELAQLLETLARTTAPIPGQQYLMAALVDDSEVVLRNLGEWIQASLPMLPPWIRDAHIRLLTELFLGADLNVEAARWAALTLRMLPDDSTPATTYALFHRAIALARLRRPSATKVAMRALAAGSDIEWQWPKAWHPYLQGLLSANDGDSCAARELLSAAANGFRALGAPHLARLPEADLSRLEKGVAG